MRTDVLRRFRNCVVGAVAFALTTAMVTPTYAARARDGGVPRVVGAPQGFGTVSQKGLRLVIKVLKSPGMPRIMQFLARHQATEEQIGTVVRYAGATAKILEQFTKIDQASLGFVRGQVEALLVKGCGATQVDASRVGFWVEKMLDWGI